MRKIEFLRALDDNTWDTVLVDVPTIEEDPANGVDFDATDTLDTELHDYAMSQLAPQAQHRCVVLFAVYNTDPES